jgi:hypothetical protein
MTEINTTHIPPGWGDDELTKFLDHFRHHQFATFERKGPASQRLIRIDALFLRAVKDWVNPSHPLPANLLFRCHAAFRAACGLAMAGEVAETFPVCRVMIEYAAYAVHIYRDASLQAVWHNRHQDAASMTNQRQAFSHGKVVTSVEAANRDAAQRFKDLYQRCIDFGGHPNQHAVFANMTLVELAIGHVYLHEDGVALDNALRNTAQCGMVSLELLQVVFNARFELLGINAEMLQLRDGL